MLLSKDETTIGRAEWCDIGLFGSHGVEKLHAKILRREGQFYLADNNTPGGTYLNDVRVKEPMLLHNGDLIRLGDCLLKFGEKQPRRSLVAK